MRVTVSTSGDPKLILDKKVDVADQRVKAAVDAAGRVLQDDIRGQVTAAGLGRRLAQSIRRQTYPNPETPLSAAALVWTKAPKIIGAFAKGVLLKSSQGLYLAIPTENAGRSTRGGRITPEEWERRNGTPLRAVFHPGKPALLVAQLRARTGKKGGFAAPSATARRTGKNLVTVAIFILVPQARLTKRIDLKAAAARGNATLSAQLRRRLQKL